MKAAAVNVMIKMITGDYEKEVHVHKCVKCSAKWPHDVKDCQWPKPWYCPDCEEE
jgi:hypothetical protein